MLRLQQYQQVAAQHAGHMGGAPAAALPGSGCKAAGAATPVKRPRLVWTQALHQRFVEAVKKLGEPKAVPKNIMQHMAVEGLTRENVASHLQKYRLYMKRQRGEQKAASSGEEKADSKDAAKNAETKADAKSAGATVVDAAGPASAPP